MRNWIRLLGSCECVHLLIDYVLAVKSRGVSVTTESTDDGTRGLSVRLLSEEAPVTLTDTGLADPGGITCWLLVWWSFGDAADLLPVEEPLDKSIGWSVSELIAGGEEGMETGEDGHGEQWELSIPAETIESR